jgi:hypothetical protein
MVHRTIRGGKTAGRKVVTLLKVQYWLFILGIGAFGLFVALMLFLPTSEAARRSGKGDTPGERAELGTSADRGNGE